MIELNKEYIIATLREERLWKVGEADTFKYGDWDIVIRREEDDYAPFKFSLNGRNDKSRQSWCRRYVSMEKAFLHILNGFNENSNTKNIYNTIADYIEQNNDILY